MFYKIAKYECLRCDIGIIVSKLQDNDDWHPKIVCPWCGNYDSIKNLNINAKN